jgi:tRNA(Glu) U13 pseudouridine synthase TruD
MKFKIHCEDANHICDKSQYKEACFWEKLKLNLHLLYCKACRKYSLRNQKLSNLMERSNIKTVPKTNKDELKEKLRKELDK